DEAETTAGPRVSRSPAFGSTCGSEGGTRTAATPVPAVSRLAFPLHRQTLREDTTMAQRRKMLRSNEKKARTQAKPARTASRRAKASSARASGAPVRYAVVGQGYIAQVAVLPASA